MKYNDKALEDFNKLCEIAETKNEGPNSISKAYFYKAKAMKKTNNHNDAILHFEQVLRLSDDNFLQSSSLYEIAKIRIQ
jgi:tetratricopeptide (TPR) repeat protein